MKLSWSSCCGGLAYPGCHEDVILSNMTVFALNANRSVLLLVGNSIMLITTECKWTLREEISEMLGTDQGHSGQWPHGTVM